MHYLKTILTGLLISGISVFASAQYQNTTIKIGQEAPELAFEDPAGNVISLKKIAKNSYVLIDFWASWCGPCRRANPALVSFYNEFKDHKFKDAPRGLKIYSVSLDRNKDSWVKAIETDGLSWPYHVSDLQSWKSEAARIYGVNYIPQVFLMGPDGKIIGKYNSTGEAKVELQKYVKEK